MKRIIYLLLTLSAVFSACNDHIDYYGKILPNPYIELDYSSIDLNVGETFNLQAIVMPYEARDKGIEWTSSNPSVAIVDGGTVTALNAGTATITASAIADKTQKACCEVRVIESTEQTRTFTANGVSFTMIYVEPGTFQMGSTTGDSDEKPVHSVTISKGYYIGETEVTQALWKAVTGNSPTMSGSSWSTTYGLGDNYPAYYISYEDVQSFITKLNSLTGAQFRMPTEAEWEFAARGGNKSKGYEYSGSNTVGDVAWYYNNSGSKTHAVKTKAANELGIYDMSGNVWEWCSDWYGSYSSSSVTDPTGPASGWDRVSRGGSWSYYAALCRSANRNSYTPSARSGNLGVRLACSAVLP